MQNDISVSRLACSNLRAPEPLRVLLIAEVLSSLCHDHSLCSISISLQLSLDSCVLVLALASSNVPSVSDHQFEVVIIVYGGTHIFVVVKPLFCSNPSILIESVPLSKEVLKDSILGFLSLFLSKNLKILSNSEGVRL